jgi:predicted DNA-binding transcriptional regulator AlpA
VLSVLRSPSPAIGIVDAPPADSVESLKDVPFAGQPKSMVAAVERLLVDTEHAAVTCSISTASWYRLKAAGRTPAPVKLGGRTLYRIEDLRLWVRLGCPTRKEFETRKAANQAKT